MSMVGLNASAHDIEVKNADGVTIYYNYINNSTKLAVTYQGSYSYSYSNEYTGNVVIPESVTYNNKTYSVTSIGSYAFYDCSGLTSITIPNSVTSIGGAAFSGCSGLTSIDIPNSVTSIESAFSGCSGLTSITIPNSVTSIGGNAFDSCSGLTSVIWKAKKCTSFSSDTDAPFYNIRTQIKEFNFGDGVETIPDYLCYCMTGLTSITIPNSVINIGRFTFRSCSGLTEVHLPNSVTSIGDYAFQYCSGLTSITIPNSVTSIGSYAFYNTNLKSVTIGAGVLTIGSNVFSYYSGGSRPTKVIWLTNTPPTGYTNAAGTVNYVANDLYTSLSNKTVYPFLSSMFEVNGIKYVPVSPSERTCDAIDCAYNETAENINIGETVSYQGISMKVNLIKPYACYENEKIKDVNLSLNGNVGDNAFYGCTEIQSINVTNNGDISGSAFKGCTGIQTIEVSNNGNIGSSAFYGCTSIKTAIIKNKGNIGETAFYNCTTVSNPATFEIANSGSIGGSAFSGCKGMQSAVITNNGIIGNYAFHNCGMQSATIGENVTSLGEYAFSGCSNLQSVVIPDAVTSIGKYSFEKCSSMTSAKIGSGVTIIPTYAFSGCSVLNDIQIGQNVQTIDTYAFNNCSALKSITIPKSVTGINNYVFKGCSALKNVTMEDREDNTVLTLGSNGSSPIFSSCPLDEVYIGRNISYSTSSSYGYSPFYRNTSLRSMTITDRETEISPNEFYGCTNLKEVKIGDGVTTIGNRAFSGCSSLDFFSFGSSVQTIGQEAFSDCTAMTKLISKAATPPTCGTQALDDINKWTCILQVPAHTLSLYQAADQWKEFFFIEAGIKNVNGNNSNKATIKFRYDLGGKQISQPQKGLNILKMSDGTTRKIVK